MIKKTSRNEARKARHIRVRKKIAGTKDTPRLCIFKSNKQIYAQIIDDTNGNTLISANSLEKGLNTEGKNMTETAKLVGQSIASKAKKAKISQVVFDRGGYLFHGAVKALADSARENGLEF